MYVSKKIKSWDMVIYFNDFLTLGNIFQCPTFHENVHLIFANLNLAGKLTGFKASKFSSINGWLTLIFLKMKSEILIKLLGEKTNLSAKFIEELEKTSTA